MPKFIIALWIIAVWVAMIATSFADESVALAIYTVLLAWLCRELYKPKP